MSYSKFDIANYILSRVKEPISPMKLQKLLYYCYVWQLVAGENIFKAEFKAWKYGPVEIDIYHKYKEYGSNLIPQPSDSPDLDLKLIDFVVDSYSIHSAAELSKTTHAEKPWKMYIGSQMYIPDEELIDFYKNQPFSKNFPLDPSKVFYPPKMASHDMFTFDMDSQYVPSFNSLEVYLMEYKKSKNDMNMLFDEWLR